MCVYGGALLSYIFPNLRALSGRLFFFVTQQHRKVYAKTPTSGPFPPVKNALNHFFWPPRRSQPHAGIEGQDRPPPGRRYRGPGSPPGRRAQAAGIEGQDRPQGAGRRAQGAGRRAQGAGRRAQGAGRRAQGAGRRAQGAGRRAQGAGRRAQGAGRRAQERKSRPLRQALDVRWSISCFNLRAESVDQGSCLAHRAADNI